jgi:hypothetical protein
MEQETLRHQYLEALGVSSWLPCAVLPGAAPSADWVNDFRYPAPDIPFESDRASSARAALGQQNSAGGNSQGGSSSNALSRTLNSTKASPESAQQGMSQARAALGLSDSEVNEASEIPSAAKARSVQSTSPVQSASPLETPDSVEVEANTETPNFKLAFQHIGEYLVVDSLPPQGGGFSENYQFLAQAIVVALGGQRETGQVFMLPWPMFASKTLDQGHHQASIAVQHKLTKELQAHNIKTVLLFGEAAAQMVMARHEGLDELKGISFEVRSGVKAIASHSLTEAMQLPGIKKQIWMDFQPLVTKRL